LTATEYRLPDNKSDEKRRRVSEQEARFLFTRELESQTEYYYSVETPTMETYRFSGVDIPKIAEDGRSGNVDVCLYDSQHQRIHLVEFKAHNVDVVDMLKDFLKLRYDNDGEKLTNYFVHLLETYNKGTIDNLIGKYKTIFEFRDEDYERNNNLIKNDVVVCLCFLNEKQILFFDETDVNEKLNTLKK